MGDVGYFRGAGGAIFEMDLPLPEVMAHKVTTGALRRVNADGSRYVEPADDTPPQTPEETGGEETGGDLEQLPRPAQSAPKAEWVGYAVRAHGATVDDAEAMTKQDLIDRYGRNDEEV